MNKKNFYYTKEIIGQDNKIFKTNEVYLRDDIQHSYMNFKTMVAHWHSIGQMMLDNPHKQKSDAKGYNYYISEMQDNHNLFMHIEYEQHRVLNNDDTLFIWDIIINPTHDMWGSIEHEAYKVYDDGSKILLETKEDFKQAIEDNYIITVDIP